MPLAIDVWSDVACPWCYIGKRRLEAALKEHGGDVEVTYHAFELDPKAPQTSEPGVDFAARLAKKYGTGAAQAKVMIDRVVTTAAGDGIAMHFDRLRPGNTFDAHRLIRLGTERGIGPAVKEAMMAAYFTDGKPVGERDALIEIAVAAGLPREEVDAVLGSDRYAAEVRQDEALARELGISGVPFYVIDRRIGLSGAQPVEVMRDALAQAR